VTLQDAVPFGSLVSDERSLVIARYASPGTVTRLGKPGCAVQPLQLTIYRPENAEVRGELLAWTARGHETTCVGSHLSWCNPDACVEQELPVLAGNNAAFEKLAGIELRSAYLYFSLTDGLVGRIAVGDGNIETLWVDPDYKTGDCGGGLCASMLYDIKEHGGKIYISRYALGRDVELSCGNDEQLGTGAIFAIDAVPGAEHNVLAGNLDFPTSLEVSDEYVYFFERDYASLLHRVPVQGGVDEPLAAGGELSLAPNATWLQGVVPMHVHGGYVYFGAATSAGYPKGFAIARLPAGAGPFSAEKAEIVARPTGQFSFVVDDEALYWLECDTAEVCETGRLKARRLPP
jgi:hypothetical protein